MKFSLSSNKQKKFILAGLAVAFVSSFLPAIYAPIVGSISLAKDIDGALQVLGILMVFGAIFFKKETLQVLEKNIKKPLSENLFFGFILGILSLILVRIIYIWQKIVFLDMGGGSTDEWSRAFSQMARESVGTGFGLYFTFFAILFVIVSIVAFPKLENFVNLMYKKMNELSEKKTTNTNKE